jgi:SAM-dependent methyltransferase
LNVGSGSFPVPGWINIDGNEKTAPVVDVRTDMRRPLPFQDESFEAVYCGHVLEHIRWENLRGFLDDLWRVMKPGAEIAIVGPDHERARAGGYPDEIVHACYGDPDRDDGTGEPHVWTCTTQAVVEVLDGTFTDVTALDIRDLPEHWPAISRAWWQCAVLARKASA